MRHPGTEGGAESARIDNPNDQIQISVHTYDGCGKGCPGCVVDKELKNRMRWVPLLDADALDLIHRRTVEYRDWYEENVSPTIGAWTEKSGTKRQQHTYTLKFGNHSELEAEQLAELGARLPTDYMIASTAFTTEIGRLKALADSIPGRLALEIVYDPFRDDVANIREMVLKARELGMNAFPEVGMTRRLLDFYPPERFVDECIAPIGDIGTQIQLGRYSPARSRSFRTTQMLSLDEETEWLLAVVRRIIAGGHNINLIPLALRSAVLLENHGEAAYLGEGGVDESSMPPPDGTSAEELFRMARQGMLNSFHIDRELNVYIWSEALGQHVLDTNLGYDPIGNLKTQSFHDMVTKKGGTFERMIMKEVREMTTHPKCSTCRYKTFCCGQAIQLFRKWHKDSDSRYCFGYLPVIRELQANPEFLKRSVPEFANASF